MTLDEFLERKFPQNAYVKYPGFKDLYIRKTDKVVRFKDKSSICQRIITIANVTARRPGKGAYTTLAAYLVSKGWAIFVENVHNVRFRKKLIKSGYTPVNVSEGPNYLFNYEGHLINEIQNSP